MIANREGVFWGDDRTKHTVIAHGVTIRYAVNENNVKFIWCFQKIFINLRRK